MDIPKGRYIRLLISAPPLKNESQHFYRCKQCGAWVDKRDLCDVFQHEEPHSEPPDKTH